MKFIILISLLLLAVNILGTEIYGVIDEDTVIGPEGNPWYVTHNLIVIEDVTLTISPGTEIYITAAYTDDYWNFSASGNNEAEAKTINIYGSLLAVGTESDSILFTRYPDYPDFRWGGIRILNEHPEDSKFECCILKYSAFINDSINSISCGISTKPGIIIKYCNFQDNYTSIRIFDYENGNYYPSLIYGCSFYNTDDRFIYYNGDSDLGVRLSINNSDNRTQIAFCDFNSMSIYTLNGNNDVIFCNFNNFNNPLGFSLFDNQNFYGNHLENSSNSCNMLSTDSLAYGVFRKNTFVDINHDFGYFFGVSGYGYSDVSGNVFHHSYLNIDFKPDGRFYNNILELCDVETFCDYEQVGIQKFYNNFIYNSSLSFWGYGDCHYYNNIICGTVCNSGLTLYDSEAECYAFNNFMDTWLFLATYFTDGDGIYHYNNIYNDREHYVEENFERTTYNMYNNFLTYNMPDFLTDCGGNLEDMDIALAGVIIDTLAHTFSLSDSSLCIDAGYADTTFCIWDYSYNFSPFDGDGDGIAVVDIGPVEYGSYFTIGYVKCTVTDLDGVPLDIIRGEAAGECVEYTGLDGSFVMSLPEGTYNLVLESPFYFSDSLYVAVNVSDTSYVSVSLEASYPFVDAVEDELPVVNKSELVCYPNPFNPELTIAFFTTETTESTEINIYNVKGQKVKSLVSAVLSAGEHSVVWDGRNEKGLRCSSGLYLVRAEINGREVTEKALLLK